MRKQRKTEERWLERIVGRKVCWQRRGEEEVVWRYKRRNRYGGSLGGERRKNVESRNHKTKR